MVCLRRISWSRDFSTSRAGHPRPDKEAGPPLAQDHHSGTSGSTLDQQGIFKVQQMLRLNLAVGGERLERRDGLHFLPLLWPLRAPSSLAGPTCCLQSTACFLRLAMRVLSSGPKHLASHTQPHVPSYSGSLSSPIRPTWNALFPPRSLPVQIHPCPKLPSSMQPSWISWQFSSFPNFPMAFQ